MPLISLLELASRAPAIRNLLACPLRPDNPVHASGLVGSALSFLVAALYRSRPAPTLALTEDTEAAELLHGDLINILQPEEVFLYPDWELRPYDQVSPGSEIVGQRIQTLDRLSRGGSGLVITSIRALMQKTIPFRRLVESTLHIECGKAMPFEELIASCVRLGFERVDMAQTSGQFAVRGGIVDIFSHTLPHPCRVEFFDDVVESIRFFDVYTQRSTGTLTGLTLLPGREITDDPGLRAAAAQRLMEAADRAGVSGRETERHIQNGGLFEGVERYLPFYYPDAETLLSYLPTDSLILVCEPGNIHEEAQRILKEYEEAHVNRIAAGDITPSPLETVETGAAIRELLSLFPEIHLTRSSGTDPRFHLEAQPAGVYHGALELLRGRLGEWRKENASIHVVCDNPGQARRLREMLAEDAEGLDMPIGTLHTGFVLPEASLVVLTDAEIFSRYRRRRRPQKFREGLVIEDFMSLKEGDHVVHIDHGIGRYLGLHRLQVDNRVRDCLAISYAEGDRIYIPVEQLHRVQKYIGSDGEAPVLSRLGGKTWEQIKSRARKAVQDIAQDLIKLYAARQANPGYSFAPDTPWQREMEEAFIYEETPDQLQAALDVKQDMERVTPMDRLVCGDVGYGKTEVAIRAAFKAVMDGKQVAALVPTTILAQQHLSTFSERLADFPVKIRMLSRFVSPAEQKETLEGLKKGEVDVVIGTHRLIQKDIQFKDLGLLIIDEEQRFGVAHKERLKQLKQTIDVLTMTATPIPRTLHMALAGARDMSIINTPPKDRLPVHTEVVRFNEETIREAILREVDRGGQVFFVHNRVESIEAMTHFLTSLLPEITFETAHGQMPEHLLEQVMIDFMNRKFDVLISTMIIESGLDMPNVNTIVINRADRFGLAQLYQLRGRVGRSHHRAYAYLLVPASGGVTPEARKRLAVISEYTALGSGFHIAMRDMEIRGAGNLLGPQQHGFMASVGFDLYCRLLQEAVQELSGNAVEERVEPVIDLRVEAFIPDDYISDRKLKIGVYQRLARFTTREELDQIEEEIRDRFGRLPEPVSNLIGLVAIKLLAGQIGLKSVTVHDEGVIIQYTEGAYPSRDQLGAITRDLRINVEFPRTPAFQIRLGRKGATDAEHIAMTKNVLMLLTG